MFRYTYIVLLLAVVIGGCSEAVSTGGSSVIMPLKEGNEWIYQYSLYELDSAGVTLQGKHNDTLHLGSPITKGSDNWYFGLYLHPFSQPDTTFYFNRSDGLWETLYSFPHLKYKYPTFTKDTFDIISNNWPVPGVIEKTFTETISTSESVTVPAGTYNCIHYRRHEQHIDSATMAIKDDTNMGDDFVSPGIGVIKSVGDFYTISGPPDSLQFKHLHEETVLLKYTLQ